MRSGWLLAIGFYGCYTPSVHEGAPCGPAGECPRTLVCESNSCVRPGGDASVDDAAVDADIDAYVSIDAPIDADLSCTCNGNDLVCGGAPTVTCDLGCSPSTSAHCKRVDPSNNVPTSYVGALATPIAISGPTTFDTDTGAISGAIQRGAGPGVMADIGFETIAGIGVFEMASLTISTNGAIEFVGTNAAAIVVGGDATIDGTIDGNAGCMNDKSCAGPGAGRGANLAGAPPTGCGPGGAGASTAGTGTQGDSGGGGGGGGGPGASGGNGGNGSLGGGSGAACISSSIEPLVGGSGGATGGAGSATVKTVGGGGGGAFQLSALTGDITVNGTITMGGAGGGGGTPGPAGGSVGGGGAGGGAGGGGAILVEASNVTLAAASKLAANGGGGGGGGAGAMIGGNGADGGTDTVPAIGGTTPSAGNGIGGNGAAGTTPPMVGQTSGGNGGGGGGAIGRIFIRTKSAPSIGGSASPAPNTGPVRTR